MSTPYSWPASLPVFSRDPYSVSPRPGAIQVDSGIDSARALVYTEVNEVVQVEALLSGMQEIAFWNFFENTLAMGTQSFVVPILIGGSLTNREAIFIGAPPSIVPANKYGYVRASFSLLTWPGQVDPYDFLSATYAVNIDAHDFGVSAPLPASPIGTTVTINTLASDRVVITKPSIATDTDLTWNAWSAWGTDLGGGDNLSWIHRHVISDQDGAQLYFRDASTRGATAADLLALVQPDYPMEFTGSTQYKFWSFDTELVDNRGGLSLRVDVYSLT